MNMGVMVSRTVGAGMDRLAAPGLEQHRTTDQENGAVTDKAQPGHLIDRRRKARGLLYGYVILLKDNIEADGKTWSAVEEDAFRSPIRVR